MFCSVDSSSFASSSSSRASSCASRVIINDSIVMRVIWGLSIHMDAGATRD